MHSSLSRARSSSSALAGARSASKSRARGARSLARTRVGVDPQHAFEVATSALDAVNLDLSLSGAEEALGKGAFGALSLASGVFGGKVRERWDDARTRGGRARGTRGLTDATGGLRERVLARGDVATTRARLSACEAR